MNLHKRCLDSTSGFVSESALKLLLFVTVIALFVGGFWLGQTVIERSKIKTMTRAQLKNNSLRSTSQDDGPAEGLASTTASSELGSNESSTSAGEDMRFIYFQKIAELDAQATAYGLCLEDINPFSGKNCPPQDELMEILAENKAKQDELIHKIKWNDIPVAEKKDCELKCRCSLILRIIEENNIIVPAKILKTLEKKAESISNDNKVHCVNSLVK